jgi:hypothetical protein
MVLFAASFGAGAGGPDGADDAARRWDRLEAGVRAEEEIRAVKRLQNTYCQYLEMGLWPALADLFADSAVAQFQNETVTGRENILEHLMRQAGRSSPGLDKGQLNTYFILQPIVTLGADGKTAKGTWHEMTLLGKFDSSAWWLGGVYENEYTSTGGVWKINRLRYFEQYRGAYDEYGHKAPPRWGIPYHFDAAHVGVTIPPSALEALTPVSSDSSAASRLAPLAIRVQRLKDETRVQNLQHSYGYYLDRKMWDDVADLFAEDGSLEAERPRMYKSKLRIRRALDALYGPAPLCSGELFDHISLTTVFTIAPDGRSAGARTSLLSMLGLNGEYARWELGIYENTAVKENGEWKLGAQDLYHIFNASYRNGWARIGAEAPAKIPAARWPGATCPAVGLLGAWAEPHHRISS